MCAENNIVWLSIDENSPDYLFICLYVFFLPQILNVLKKIVAHICICNLIYIF